MFGVALVVSLAVLGLVAGACASVARRLWVGSQWLAPAYALLGLGVVANIAWVLCWWSRAACVLFAFVVVLASVLQLARDRLRVVAARRSWLPLTGLTAALLGTFVGHGSLWGGLRDPFVSAASRYGTLPGDNFLQYNFAYNLWNNLSTVQFYRDWNGSDRPPLQSGILLLIRPFESIAGIAPDAGLRDVQAMQWGLAGSVVAQMCWVLGLYALLRALRFRRDFVLVTIVFVSVIPLSIWNVTYTWPKMMSAGFALAAIAVLVTQLLDRSRPLVASLVAAAMLFVLAFLSHGGAAFISPVLLFLGLLSLRGRGVKATVSAGCYTVGVSALLYLPWWLYGKYADPAHSRLLKWHLAGVIPANDDPFLPTLIQAYRRESLAAIVHAREANLRRVFDHDLSARLHPGASWPGPLRGQDFFSPPFAIGFATIALIAFAAVAVTRLLGRGRRSQEFDVSFLLIMLNFGCMLLWALVMFLPDGAVVHTGTYVWLIVFAAVPFAWTLSWSRLLGLLLLIAQTVYTAIVYTAPDPSFAAPNLSPVPMVILGIGVAGTACLLALAAQWDSSAAVLLDDTAKPGAQELTEYTY